MDKYIKTLATAIGVGLGARLTVYQTSTGSHFAIAGLEGAIVGIVVTLVLEFGIYALLKSFRLGRSMLDPRSVYDGLWLEDFEGRRPNKPYSIVRLIYDMPTKQYKITGRIVNAAGDVLGTFESDLVALDAHMHKIESSYDCKLTKNGQEHQGCGLNSFTFASASANCDWGTGQLSTHLPDRGALQFKMRRLTHKYAKKVLGLSGLRGGNAFDRDPDAERQIIRAYHSRQLALVSRAGPNGDLGAESNGPAVHS